MSNAKKRFRVAHETYDRYHAPVGETSMAAQEFKTQCDVNHIMRKFEKTNLLNHVNRREGQYGDFMEARSYHESLNLIREADEMFMTVPSKIRERFDNDAGKFLAFVQDEANAEAMAEMGLLKPGQVPAEPAPEALEEPPEAPPGGDQHPPT